MAKKRKVQRSASRKPKRKPRQRSQAERAVVVEMAVRPPSLFQRMLAEERERKRRLEIRAPAKGAKRLDDALPLKDNENHEKSTAPQRAARLGFDESTITKHMQKLKLPPPGEPAR